MATESSSTMDQLDVSRSSTFTSTSSADDNFDGLQDDTETRPRRIPLKSNLPKLAVEFLLSETFLKELLHLHLHLRNLPIPGDISSISPRSTIRRWLDLESSSPCASFPSASINWTISGELGHLFGKRLAPGLSLSRFQNASIALTPMRHLLPMQREFRPSRREYRIWIPKACPRCISCRSLREN